jgi:hypothetical protein
MPISYIPIGYTMQAILNVSYAIPARRCAYAVNGGTWEVSVDGIIWNAVTPVDNAFNTSASFIRLKTGTDIVIRAQAL